MSINAHIKYIASLSKKQGIDDLGCGNLQRAYEIIGTDSTIRIHGFDKEYIQTDHKAIKTYQVDLSHGKFESKSKIALLAWPINRPSSAGGPKWESILPQYTQVIYIGKNTDGMCCGSLELWRYLITLNVQAVIPDRQETLIHYTTAPRVSSKTLIEEQSGIAAWLGGNIVAYVEDTI